MPARIPDEVKAAAFANAGLRLLEPVRGDSKTKLRYECEKCGHPDKKSYNDVYNGTGCPKCAMRQVGEMKRWTLEKAKTVFKAVGLTVLSTEYKDTNTALDYACDTCGHIDKLIPNKAAQGRGCKGCGLGRKGSGNRLTREDVEETLKSQSLSWVSGEYKTGKSLLKVRCEQCGSVFDDRLINLEKAKWPCEECRVHTYDGGARPPKYCVEDVAKRFDELGLTLLEVTYLGYDVPHQYRCKTCGYENGKRPADAFTQATGCKQCGRKRVAESHRLTAAKYEQRFRKRGVAALQIPTSPFQEVGLRCLSCGREDKMSLAQLERSNPCKACNPPKYVSVPVSRYHELAKTYNGKLISKGKTTNQDSTWNCEVGHTFYRTYSSILNGDSFCNLCTAGFQEMLAKAIVEKLFGRPFIKIRIAGSKSVGGKTLEVDLYNEDLRLAVEMNGFQHYQPVDFTGKGKEAAEKNFAIQQENDRRRAAACEDAGMTLLVVRELGDVTPVEVFRQMLAETCQSKGIPIPDSFWTANIDGIKPPTRNAEYWKRAVAQAAEWGLRPEKNEFTLSTDRHWWICAKGCRVPMRPFDIVQKRVAGCPECYKKKHYKPVELSDGRVFRSGADAARALGMKPSSIYWAMNKGKKVRGVLPKLISLRRYEQIIAAERPK